MASFITNSLKEGQSTLEAFLESSNVEQIQRAVDLLVSTYEYGGKVFSCGNGGSMCDAMHFAEELTGRYRKDRASLPAVAINDPSHISCVANDFGYDQIFSRFLEGWGNKGDTLVAISTSGNSPNVIKATEVAKSKGMTVIGLLGKGGGQLKEMVDIPIIVESKITDRIQEIHIKCIHIFIEGVERSLFPENYQD